MSGQPKPAFYAVLALVVVGLVAFAAYRSDLLFPKGEGEQGPGVIDPTKLGTAEAPDSDSPTTVKEFTYVASERLPPVKGTAGYQPMEDNTVRFALNVWAGWAPIIYANEGFRPGKVWKTPDGKEFKVDLVLIDEPITMRDQYAAGSVHIGWGTLDMVPLFVDGFVDASGKPIDSRIMPRIFQQVDWSNGGDGIVVRDAIQSARDLRGKRIALAQNSPSHYFLLNMLVASGVQPGEVKMDFTSSAFEAAAAFNADKNIAAAVSWAPDIYTLSEQQGNRMLVTTGTANKLIADVWFARADFAQDHPEICEGLVRGIFDAMVELKTEDAKQKVSEWMAEGYGLKPADALGMLADAHSTNWQENYQFFVNQNNPTNFARVWNQAYYLYQQVRVIKNRPVPFDQVMDYSIIKKLGEEEKYKSQVDEYQVKFVPKGAKEIKGLEKPILTNTVMIHFYPNSWDLFKKITKDENGKTVEQLYDIKVNLIIDEIGELAGRFGNSRIIIEGHTDSSMQGQVPEDMVLELSRNRANAVKEAVVEKFKLDPNQLNVEGYGWQVPADPTDPTNHTKNRRVEVKVYTAEAQ